MNRSAVRLTGFAISLALAAGLSASAEPRATLGAGGALDRPTLDDGPSGPLRVTAVRLNPGGFQPCPDSNLPLGMLNGRRNPDAEQIKCVTAEVTIEGIPPGRAYPALHADLEGWGFPVTDDGLRYNYRAAAQLYQEQYDVGAVGPAGVSHWSWNALAVTYYDGKLDWAAQQSSAGSLIANAPEPIRDHLQNPGAWISFSIVGSSAPVVRCRYLAPAPPAADRLICDGLPRDLVAPRPTGPNPYGRPR